MSSPEARTAGEESAYAGGRFVVRERVNDYVGPAVWAYVSWGGPCPDSPSGGHRLGLLSHVCLKCRMPAVVTYPCAPSPHGSGAS